MLDVLAQASFLTCRRPYRLTLTVTRNIVPRPLLAPIPIVKELPVLLQHRQSVSIHQLKVAFVSYKRRQANEIAIYIYANWTLWRKWLWFGRKMPQRLTKVLWSISLGSVIC